MAPKRGGRHVVKDINKELEAQLAVFSRGGGEEAGRSREEVRDAVLDHVSGSDRMKREIEQLSNEAQSVAKMKKLVANQLRNARRRQARLKTKARNLSVQDLMDCISMHKEVGQKRGKAERRRRLDPEGRRRVDRHHDPSCLRRQGLRSMRAQEMLRLVNFPMSREARRSASLHVVLLYRRTECYCRVKRTPARC